MKRILLVIVIALTLIAFSKAVEAPEKEDEIITLIKEVPAVEEKIIYIEVDNDHVVKPLDKSFNMDLSFYTLEDLEKSIQEERKVQEQAHSLAEAARALGWPEDCDAIQNAKTTWHNAQLKIDIYSVEYELKYIESKEYKLMQKSSEYPVATQIWRYMKDLGWNDYVCAGILGNIMVEVGGQTFDIQYWLKSGNYYGMCQWSKTWYSEIWGADLNSQLDYLSKTIEKEFEMFGSLYKRGFDYNDFLAMTDEREAALAFAKCYERCNSKYYSIRQTSAEKAYNYFIN